jgi:hypothetical protein
MASGDTVDVDRARRHAMGRMSIGLADSIRRMPIRLVDAIRWMSMRYARRTFRLRSA